MKKFLCLVILERRLLLVMSKTLKSKNVVATKNSDYSEGNRSSIRIDSGVEPRHETVNSSELEGIVNIASLQEEHSLPSHFGKKIQTNYVQKSPFGQSKSKNVVGTKNSDYSEGNGNSIRIDSGV